MSSIRMSCLQFRTSVNELVGFRRRAGDLSVYRYSDILLQTLCRTWIQNQSKARSGLMHVWRLVCCLRPLVNSCAHSVWPTETVYFLSYTHTLTHWCSLFALKAAVGCDPCHVNVASSASLWKAKVMLGIVGSRWNRFRIGSSVIPTVTLDPK